jgi:signal transduction histidine kinase
MKISLETKIILSLGVVLSTLLAVYAYTDMSYEKSMTYRMVYRQLESLTNTIQKSLIKDMRSGRGTDVQEILELVGTEPGIDAIRIFDDTGKILKSGRREEVGHEAAPYLREMYRQGKRDSVTYESGKPVIHIVHPIANAPLCNGCHGRKKEIIGVLVLDYSLDDMDSFLSAHKKRLTFALGLTVILVGVLIFLMLKSMVSDPIVRLQAAMAEAEKGNLDISIDVGSGDEIGSLQHNFNRMLSRIKGLNEENLAQQKAIIQKEQELKVSDELARKNAEIAHASKEAVEKNRYYMEMLSFISHELKSPLVVLKGYTSLLVNGDLDELKESQLEAVQAMDRSVDALNEMISNYMDLSRLERGELAPHKRRFSIVDELVRPLMYEYAETLNKSSMSMRIDCTDEEIAMVGDPSLLKSVLGNLVSNAVKYGKPGTDIIVEAGHVNGDVRLAVFNEGEGIPARDLDKVFGRFSRLDNDVTRSRKGTGLGLYLVKVIVELHGGEVVAESKEGSWARIVCTLPSVVQEG